MHHRHLRWTATWFAVVLGNGIAGAASPAWAAPPTAPRPAAASGAATVSGSPARATQQFAQQVLALGDHRQQPFAIVDKRAALLSIFSAGGQLLGSTPVLLGSVLGDHSVAGVGDRAQTGQLRPGDATTPAGRFQSEPGHNNTGELVIWLDYELAFAIHRLRPGAAQADRARRLAARDPRRKRVSAGCVVVPVAFFEQRVQALLGRQPGVVYVLPEHGDAATVLHGLAPSAAAAAAAAPSKLRQSGSEPAAQHHAHAQP